MKHVDNFLNRILKADYLFMLVLIIGFISCETQSKMTEAGTEVVSDAPVSEALPDILQTPQKGKIIRTADYRFKVENVRKTSEFIEKLEEKYPAYIASSQLRTQHSLLEHHITLRVQSEFFNDIMKEIDNQAIYVHFRNIVSTDVSKEFVDLESRLRSKRIVEERYTTILRNKTGTIEQVLAAEKQIGELQEEIEATIRRITYLKDQVNYSTINLEFYQNVLDEPVASNEPGLGDKFSQAFLGGLNGMIEVVIAFLYLWPLILIITSLLIYMKLKRKHLAGF